MPAKAHNYINRCYSYSVDFFVVLITVCDIKGHHEGPMTKKKKIKAHLIEI